MNEAEEIEKEAKAASIAGIKYLYIDPKTETIKFDLMKLANHLHEMFHTQYFQRVIYVYHPGLKYYTMADNEIETHVREIAETYNVKTSLKQVISEVKAHLSSMGGYTEYPFNASPTDIPVNNCILRIDFNTGEVIQMEHGPEHLFTYKLNMDYNPSIGMVPCRDLFSQWVYPEDVDVLIQIPAQGVYQMMVEQVMKLNYLIISPPHCAKSTYCDLLTLCIGEKFISDVTLHALCTDKFCTGTLEGKILNICDDLAAIPVETTEEFKKKTGKITHSIERKGVQSYPGKITCPHLFTGNFPPTVSEKTRRDPAFWKRWIVIFFPYTFEVDPTFQKRAFTEDIKSSLLNCIIDCIQKVVKTRSPVVSMETVEVMERWLKNAHPFHSYIETDRFCNGSAPSFYDKKKLLADFLEYCKTYGVDEKLWPDPNNIQAFSDAIHGDGFIPERKRKTVLQSDGTYKQESHECYMSWRAPSPSKQHLLLFSEISTPEKDGDIKRFEERLQNRK